MTDVLLCSAVCERCAGTGWVCAATGKPADFEGMCCLSPAEAVVLGPGCPHADGCRACRDSRPVILDLFCCQGGAGKGYADAGFKVIGVDIEQQDRYPFEFYRADALAVLNALAAFGFAFGQRIHGVHASPPCQHDSDCQRIQDNDHPDLIGPTRDLLEQTGLPYVIENVRGARAKLRDPQMLCGEMFGLRTYRHRWFETNWPYTPPLHPQHAVPQVKMGRAARNGEHLQIVGNFSGVDEARRVMEMPWANREGLREAIPPAYTRDIGRQLSEYVEGRLDAAA